MAIYLSLLIAFLGGVVYYISNIPKVQTLARDLWWVGWLAFLLQSAEQLLKLP